MQVMLFYYFLFCSLLNKSIQWTTTCNNQGKCELVYSNNNNNKVYIKPGYSHKFPEKGGEITKTWNKTYESIHISKQIDGTSLYGLLNGKIGYECSGGLSECLNSCCLNGFCVEILYYCNQQRDNIDQIYIVTSSAFILLICIYWVTFYVLGCSYNKMINKNDNKNTKHHFKAKSIPRDFAYNNKSRTQEEQDPSQNEAFDFNEDTNRNFILLNNNHLDNEYNYEKDKMDDNKIHKLNYKSLFNHFNNIKQNQIDDNKELNIL